MTNKELFLANEKFSLKHTKKPFYIKHGVYIRNGADCIHSYFSKDDSPRNEGRFILYDKYILLEFMVLDKQYYYKVYFSRMVFDNLKYHYPFRNEPLSTL